MLKERSFVGKSKSQFTTRIKPHPMTDARIHELLEADKRQFQQVPDTSCFLRAYYPGEFWGVSMPREMRLDSIDFVLVKRLNGAQLRIPMTATMAETYIEAMQERLHGCVVRKMALILPQKMSAEHIPLVLAHIQAIVSLAQLAEGPEGRVKIEVECSPLQEEIFHCYASSVFDAKRFEE